MKYDISVYLITCLTNMHVGSGEANYGVVDNLVQRDPITDVPIIHSSSLKGALREHCKDEPDWGENSDLLNYIFGPDTSRNKGESGIGHYKFFDANLIVLPVRSNVQPFYRATAEFLLKEVESRGNALGKNNFTISPFTTNGVERDNPKITSGNGEVYLEDYKAITELQLNNGTNHLGENPALFHENDFKELSKRLPVIARNQLENGESKNLWYEEVVPRESRFIFFVAKGEKYQDDFDNVFKKKDKEGKIIENEFITIQIGGNASIGYGYCKIEKIG